MMAAKCCQIQKNINVCVWRKREETCTSPQMWQNVKNWRKLVNWGKGTEMSFIPFLKFFCKFKMISK